MKNKYIPYYSVMLMIFFIFSSCSKQDDGISPQKALDRLMKGNERYVNNKSKHPNRNEERRKLTATNQAPYAVVVGCSDSRVSPEIIFDEGIGDLFVVRVAGNVIGPLELDSIEYAALYLNSEAVLVLGHENCGAVEAVINDNTKDIEAVATLITPAVEKARENDPDNLLEHAISMNDVGPTIVIKIAGKPLTVRN